eukprot:887129-Rhodomonas_salina.2
MHSTHLSVACDPAMPYPELTFRCRAHTENAHRQCAQCTLRRYCTRPLHCTPTVHTGSAHSDKALHT